MGGAPDLGGAPDRSSCLLSSMTRCKPQLKPQPQNTDHTITFTLKGQELWQNGFFCLSFCWCWSVWSPVPTTGIQLNRMVHLQLLGFKVGIFIKPLLQNGKTRLLRTSWRLPLIGLLRPNGRDISHRPLISTGSSLRHKCWQTPWMNRPPDCRWTTYKQPISQHRSSSWLMILVHKTRHDMLTPHD